MATTTVSSSSEVTSQSLVLRAELKEWERAFSTANGGRKPERNDIKSDPSIGMDFTSVQVTATSPIPVLPET